MSEIYDYLPLPSEIIAQIVTPPQLHNQHRLLAVPRQLLQQVNRLNPLVKSDLQTLQEIATQTPQLAGIRESSITLAPAIQDQRLLKALYDLCAYYIQLRRDGQICLPGSLKDPHDLSPEERPAEQIWCTLNVRSHATVTSIAITRYTKYELGPDGRPRHSDAENNALRASCVSDCAVLVETFLDDLRQTAIRRLATRLSPPDANLPQPICTQSHRVIFDHFGPKSNRLFQSGILTVLNRAKNVYTKGEADGRKAYRQKRQKRQPVMNDRFRMETTFTVRQKGDQLIVEFWFDGNRQPYFIVPRSHNNNRPMTDAEAHACRASFAQLCALVLQAYFRQIKEQADLMDIESDYLQPWPQTLADRDPGPSPSLRLPTDPAHLIAIG